MNVKQHIRMTASEIAMGRYMRAPDHDAAMAAPAADDEFSRAFDVELLVGDKGGQGDAGTTGGDASGAGAAAPAAGAGGDGAAPASGDGTGAAAGGEGKGAAAPAADDKGGAPAEGGAAPAAGAAADDKGGEGAAAGEGGAAAGGAGGDAGAGAAAADGGAAGKDGAGAAAVAGAGDADAIIDRLAAAVAAKAPAKAEPEAPAAEAPAAEEKPLFNADETAILDKFKDEWPTEHQAIQLMQRELGTGIIKYVFDQIAPAVREIKELADTLALRAQFGDITDGLQEYPSDEEIDQIRDWVKTQPSYLQSGMNGVIDGGTAEEVIDLVGRYREATGRKPAGAQEAPKPQVETELSGAAKQAAEALAPVGSKRSAVQSPDDTSNFDAAWDKFKVDESV